MNQLQGTFCKVDTYSRSVLIVASTPAPVGGEALTAWDLTRFLKNPTILWGHDEDALPIGTASEIEWDPEVGLKMRVTFAREAANPLAEQVYQGVIDGIVRAVSVGYDPPKDGKPALLIEVSFVAVGADEDAGTPHLTEKALPEAEQIRMRVSAAARELAGARARARASAKETYAKECEKTDAMIAGDVLRLDQIGYVLRLDRSRLGRVDRTQVGGARVPARLSRTGVLTYINPDGSKRRELRLASEIFKADSLKTLEHAPVIDIKDHTGMVTPETWRKVSLGHVTGVRQDGNFMVGELLIQDQDTLDAIENGERTEISCGYLCVLDMTPGVHEGEPYDCVQRNIRYNHAALCPPNRGRAGPEVGLRLDTTAPSWGTTTITEENEGAITMIKVKLDGKDFEFGSEAHIAKVEDMHKAVVDKLTLDAKEAVKAKDVAEAERDSAKEALVKANLDAKKSLEDLEAAKKEEAEAAKTKKRQRRKLERAALRFFAAANEAEEAEKAEKSKREFAPGTKAPPFKKEGEEDEEDEKKMDALEARIDSMSDRELMLECIKQGLPNFDATGKSDDYLAARFDSMVESSKSDRGITGVVRAAREGALNLDANNGEDIVSKARAARDKAAYEAGRNTNGATK